GLAMTTSHPANRSASAEPAWRRTPAFESASADADSEPACFVSAATTSTPRRARNPAAATPDRPSPMTPAFFHGIVGATVDEGVRVAFIEALPQLQRAQGHEREEDREDPEADDHLGLGPAHQLEVMVQRRHSEDPLAGQTER